MIQRNSLPTFSGNVESYLINQLLEFELLSKVRNVMSKVDTNKVHLSSLFGYYQHMFAKAQT